MTNRRQFLAQSVATLGAGATLISGHRFAQCQQITSTSTRTAEDQAKFLEAAKSGNLERCQAMLSLDPKLIQASNEQNQSAYAIALLNDRANIAKFLLKKGYQPDLHESALALDWPRFSERAEQLGESVEQAVNRAHPIGGNAMYCAAAGGAGTDIWRVYAQCADPNLAATNRNQETALQCALRYKDLEKAELTAATLLSNNASPNAVVNHVDSPLHLAAQRNSFVIVEMLVRLGANLEAVNHDGKTAFELAQLRSRKPIIELLENQQNISRTCRTARAAFDKDGKRYEEPDWKGLTKYRQRSVVGFAHRSLAEVKKLVAKDKRLAHAAATTSEMAVEAGTHMGNKPIVEFLLNQGAPYSTPTAVMMGDMTSVKRLVEQDPNRIHERGAHDFALLWCPIIGRCSIDMTEYLLEQGAKVEEQHFLGTTALHFACMAGNLELIELLIEHGANINRVGKKFGGRPATPLQMARSEKVRKYLQSKGAR